MNNMPYAALGGVMTGDVNERAKLNSFRFISVNVAQFIVGGFTLPLVAKFAVGHDPAVWLADDDDHLGRPVSGAVSDHVCSPPRNAFNRHRSKNRSPRQDFADLIKNSPWMVMFAMTLDPFLHSLVPGRRALQLLSSLRRQGGDVRLGAKTRTRPRRRCAPGRPAGHSGMAGLHRSRRPVRSGRIPTSPTSSTASST